jgi:hypothetical protein
MGKKILGIVVIGLVFALIIPVGSSYTQQTGENANTMSINKPASQLEITIKGGIGIHAFIKNTGTTDINDAEVEIILDGPGIIWGSDIRAGGLDIKAGKTQILICPVFGFGATNIELTIDTTTQTTSGKVLFYFVFGVE